MTNRKALMFLLESKVLYLAADRPPILLLGHPGKVRSISLVSSSTAIHILGESIAINKAIQKRQVQARQREHSQILSEPKARRLDLSVYTEKKTHTQKKTGGGGLLGRGGKTGPRGVEEGQGGR